MTDDDYYDRVWPLPHQNTGGWTGWTRYNGGQKCDMDEGPCACGAWHSKQEKIVQLNPIYMGTFGEDRAPQPKKL